jgi:hypothetical protein
MPHGRGIRAYMDVFTACLGQLLPSYALDGDNTNLFKSLLANTTCMEV